MGPFLRRSERSSDSETKFTNVFVKNLDEGALVLLADCWLGARHEIGGGSRASQQYALPVALRHTCSTCMRAPLGDDTLIPLLIPSDRLFTVFVPRQPPSLPTVL